MAAFIPAWRPLDAAHSTRLLPERPSGGRVVALCVGRSLAGRPEGTRLAVALVRRWTEGGLNVVLMDGDLARPILHLTLGLANVKGLADILLVGDDWEALALATSVPGLRLVPAGGGAPPTSSVAARERLAELCRAVAADGSVLVIYVPLGTMLTEWTLEVCTDIVVLSAEGEDVADLFAEDEDRIRAHIGPAPLAHRLPEGAPPPRTGGGGSEPRRGIPPPPEEPAAPRDEGARERESAVGLHPLGSRSRIEDRWAQAAAMLRARQQTPGPVHPPEAPPETLSETPRTPSSVFPSPETRETPPPPPAQEPLPLWSPPPLEPPRAAPPPLPRPERGKGVKGIEDPLAIPPIMMAEWDRFGDEEERARRAERRKNLALKILGGLGGVALVAGAVWVWSATREMPPYEARSSALPRAAIPSAEGATAAPPAPVQEPGPAVDSGQASAPTSTPPPSTVPETRAPHQRYSWSLAAMGSLETASGLVAQLRRRAPGEAFMIAPIVSDGRTLYRVLGGLAADREELMRIREPLGRATGQTAGTWLVREAPLAFSLEDFQDAASASARVAELARQGVPAYVLVVERDDGSSVHRVYAGAYADEGETAAMRALLESAGMGSAPLVERRGRPGS